MALKIGESYGDAYGHVLDSAYMSQREGRYGTILKFRVVAPFEPRGLRAKSIVARYTPAIRRSISIVDVRRTATRTDFAVTDEYIITLFVDNYSQEAPSTILQLIEQD